MSPFRYAVTVGGEKPLRVFRRYEDARREADAFIEYEDAADVVIWKLLGEDFEPVCVLGTAS